MTDWRDTFAETQTAFREANERTEREYDVRTGLDRTNDVYVCECSDSACTEPIVMTRDEYEDVRAVPIRYAVALNHENPEIDILVSENYRFATVDTVFRAGARISRSTNPRRAA